MNNEHATPLDRRTFMKGIGLAAATAGLGVGATGGAAARETFPPAFANFRVREARKVWDRGFRGRPDRTLGLTDSGTESRHPDLGPWNGVRARKVTDAEGSSHLELFSVTGTSGGTPVGEAIAFSGLVGPGAADGGETTTTRATHAITAPADAERVDVTLSWTANTQDLDFFLENADGERIAQSINFGGPERIQKVVEAGADYTLVVETYASVAAEYTIDGGWQRGGLAESPFRGDVFADVGDDPASASKIVGWYNEEGGPANPRDTNGHGTHVSSIMAGSGRASAVDVDRLTVDEPHATLLPGDFLAYEVPALAGTGLFISAYGENIEVEIEGPDGRTIETGGLNADWSLQDNCLIDHPTTADHDAAGGEATYTLYVKPLREPETTTATAGVVDTVAAGAFLPADETGGDRDGGDVTVHAGVAPNSGIVGLKGLGAPTEDLGELAADFSELFNMRAVNMSWGAIGGVPFGALGGTIDTAPAALRKMAAEGILPVTAAGNTVTPANGNSSPAVVDEAVSVVATDRLDGLTSYTSGGVGSLDEDETKVDRKPDVSAPGGAAEGYPAGAYDLARAAQRGDPDGPDDERVRDYTLKAGTSMASPYACGATGLVAHAMEDAAPASIALPAPADAGLGDAMRLKQVLLATATESAFTAAPFHHPTHRPTYEFGGRDLYEGFGRINPDAAVDAVSVDLLPGTRDAAPDGTASASCDCTLGLNVPDDARAVAGYVDAPGGSVAAELSFSHYAGGNKGMAKDLPHVDLFVYDAAAPATNGEPNIVASAQALSGAASLSFDVPRETDERPTKTYYVVAKLVNVPGAFNGNDVRAHLELDLSFERLPPVANPFVPSGTRSDDGNAFTQGQTDQVDVTITSLPEGVSEVEVFDRVPDGWEPQPYGDYAGYENEEEGIVRLGTVTREEVENGDATRTYFVEATGGAGAYTFGPAEAVIVGDTDYDNDAATVGGTDTNYVVGVDQNDPAGSAESTVEEDGLAGTDDLLGL